MIAFLCHFYGGMPASWLEIPVRTFFAMFREGVRMEARHYSELADISLIADNMNITYYESVKKRYQRIIDPESMKHPDKPPGFTLDAGGEDAKKLMKSVGLKMRRNLGYGR
jgi:hypothetical protein